MGRKSQKDTRRVEIVNAFARVLADHGYAGATMNAVAFEAGLSPGLLHHNFKNKQEMLSELLNYLLERFRKNFKDSTNSIPQTIDAYIDVALKLDHKADSVLARCWVGVLAESLREPQLFERVKHYLDREVDYLEKLSGNTLETKDCGALLAFILGALVFGAFAPKRTSGFAAEAGKKLVGSLSRKK